MTSGQIAETTLLIIRYLSQTSQSTVSICRHCPTPVPFRAQLLRHRVMRGQRISREQRGSYGIDLKALDARHAGEKLLPALWKSSRLTFTQAPAERGFGCFLICRDPAPARLRTKTLPGSSRSPTMWGGGHKVPRKQRIAIPAGRAQVGWGQKMRPWGWGKSPSPGPLSLPVPVMGGDPGS